MIRQAHDGRIRLFLREEFAEVDVLLWGGHAFLDDGFGRGGEDALVDVADRDDLDALLGHQLAHVAAALRLKADTDELQAVARGNRAIFAQRGGRDDGGEAEKGAG